MNVAKLSGDNLRWWCPGCDSNHVVPVNQPAPEVTWYFDGNLKSPTLSPSVLVGSHETLTDDYPGWPELITDHYRRVTPTCHSFVKAGKIQFLDDCTHELAGQTVPMGPVK